MLLWHEKVFAFREFFVETQKDCQVNLLLDTSNKLLLLLLMVLLLLVLVLWLLLFVAVIIITIIVGIVCFLERFNVLALP